MSSLDKLLKAIEVVRGTQSSLEKSRSSIEDDANLRLTSHQSSDSSDNSYRSGSFSSVSPLPSQGILLKKEQPLSARDKLVLCQSISDSVTVGSKSNSEVQKLISIGIESLLLLVDDENPDVRMNADESLNRIIRCLSDVHSNKLLLEFFKEIKKNGRTRSLRASLSKFGVLCRYIRPQKCRAYIQNLIPHLIKIARRQEESLFETLVSFLEKVLPLLGHFTNDNEIRQLIKAFLPNSMSVSASIRRSAVSSLILFCQFSRKPKFFFLWLLETILQMMIPVSEESPSNEVVGVLLLIRYLAPHFPLLCIPPNESLQLNVDKQSSTKNNECHLRLDHFAQVYELCIHYSSSEEYSIVTASLETLQVLLQNPCPLMLALLLSPEGMRRSRIHNVENKKFLSSRTASQVSIISSLAEDEINLDLVNLRGFNELHNESIEPSLDPPPRADSLESDSAVVCEDSHSASRKSSASHELSGADDDDKNEDDLYASIEVGCLVDDSDPFDLSQVKICQPSNTLKHKRKVNSFSCEEKRGKNSWVPKEELNKRIGNIGTFYDEDVHLKYLARFLCSSFLLSGWPSSLLSDQKVKISIKVLALNCIVLVVSFQPSILSLGLFIDDDLEDGQALEDVFLFEHHPDPQIQSSVASIAGSFIHATLQNTNGEYDSFGKLQLELASLLSILGNILKYESSISIRGTLSSLCICLPEVLHSPHAKSACHIIDQLFETCHHSYWLVKVELVELLSKISVDFIDYLESNSTQIGFHCSLSSSFSCKGKRFSHRLISAVFIPLLGDSDHRVRNAAANSLHKLLPHLSMQDDVVNSFCGESISPEFCPISHSFGTGSYLLSACCLLPDKSINMRFEREFFSLPRLVQTISAKLLYTTNKHLKLGCLKALRLLSENYPPLEYPYLWGCHALPPRLKEQQPYRNQHIGLISLVLNLSSEHMMSIELSAQQDILIFLANYIAGRVSLKLETKNDVEVTIDKKPPWFMLGDLQIQNLTEHFVKHILRIINIYYHVLEEAPPGAKNVLLQPGPVSALSPIKRRSRGETEKDKLQAHAVLKAEKHTDSDEKERKMSKSAFVGIFVHLPEYLRLYEVIKSAYANYKICLDDATKNKLTGLLEASFKALGVLLKISTIVEFGPFTEELLKYFKVTCSLLPAATISCGKQLLNCLFCANKTRNPVLSPCDEIGLIQMKKTPMKDIYNESLFTKAFSNPLLELQSNLDALFKGHQAFESLKVLKKRGSALSMNLQPKPMDRASLSSYIRLFEPLVIKALKLYTVSSDVKLQRAVLDLLIHLVEIRVNYCLLDSEQIFIGYIIKQFEYIEEGQIKNAEELIPSIFKFLVLLSYERHHSKNIIGVPKIIQLCDGLLASGQPPLSHCVLALRPLVFDLFLERGQSSGIDQKELETQKEVICSMLLRLSHYHQVLHLISLVLVTSQRVDIERWRKLSYQVLEILLSHISKLKVNINSKVALCAVEEVLRSICPSVLLPPDAILKAMLSSPCEIQTTEEVERWMGGGLVLLRILICHAQVDTILSSLDQLGLSLDFVRSTSEMSSSLSCSIQSTSSPMRCSYQRSCQMSSSGESLFRDPLNVTSPPIEPEHSLARYFLEMILVCAKELGSFHTSACQEHQLNIGGKNGRSTPSSSNFLIHLSYHLLLTLVHLAETGQWQRVLNALKEIIHSERDLTTAITSGFMLILRWSPSLTLQWFRLLCLLDYSDPLLWSKLLGIPSKASQPSLSEVSSPAVVEEKESLCLSLEFAKRAGILVLSEFVVKHFQEGNWLMVILVEHINDVIILCDEPPIQELLKKVYTSSAASSLLLQAIQTRCNLIYRGEYGSRFVGLLSGVHHDQSGALVSFLVDHFLSSPLFALSREAASVAAQRLHLLIAEESNQMLPVDIERLILSMKEENLHKRYGQVFSLLQQLLKLYSERSPVCFAEAVDPVTPATETSPDLSWYLQLVTSRCSIGGGGGEECAKLLSQLEFSDALAIMTSKNFNRALLPYTFKHGLASYSQINPHWSDTSSSIETSGDSEDGCTNDAEPPLFTASKVILTQHLHELEACLPGPHLPYIQGYNDYSEQLSKMFISDPLAREAIERISLSIFYYMEGISSFHQRTEFHPDEVESLTRFAVTSLEYLNWLTSCGNVNFSTACSGLLCVNSILKNSALANYLSLSGKASYICSLVFSLHSVVLHFIHPKSLPSLPGRLEESFSDKVGHVSLSCKYLIQLILWHEQQGEKNLPHYLSDPLRGICQGLGRASIYNSIVRLPPEIWSLGWCPSLSLEGELSLPPIPVELLQETDVLKQFIFRIGFLGFVGRHQFEETWMLLLSVLNSSPTPDTPQDQIPFINLSLSLAVKGVTMLLMQTLLVPDPGNPHSSVLLSVQRDMPPSYLETTVGKKLASVIRHLELKFLDIDHIFKRPSTSLSYHGGQVSVEYLVAAMVSSHSIEDVPGFQISSAASSSAERREKVLTNCGFDVQSCLHFLHDNLYSHWLQSEMCSSVVSEVVKSISVLCDIFTTPAHHKWVLEMLIPLHSVHPVEDHITFQYIIIATSKSLASLKMAHQEVNSSLSEGVAHIVEEGLRHSQGSVRACAIQGALFLLQAQQDANAIVNLAASYISRQTESKNKDSELQALPLWDLWIYLVEHFSALPDRTLPSTALHMALAATASPSTSPQVLQKALSVIERLVLVQHLNSGTVEVVLKLMMDLIMNAPPSVCMATLPLFITALYSSTKSDSISFFMSDPETLLQFLEKLQVLFERIRIGYPFEAEIIGEILGTCLLDIMPASQILNKVITEYISSHQPHPHLLASALFQVFEAAIHEGGETLVQEWVLLSLSNFTQRTPVSLAVWCLTCFFIAASHDPWLRAVFPSVQASLGKLDSRDIQVFCLAAIHFRGNLASDNHRMKFDEVFQAVATPASPFEALMDTIKKEENEADNKEQP